MVFQYSRYELSHPPVLADRDRRERRISPRGHAGRPYRQPGQIDRMRAVGLDLPRDELADVHQVFLVAPQLLRQRRESFVRI